MNNEEFFNEEFPILVLVDEEGLEHHFELLAEIDIEDSKYRVLLPLMEEEDEETEEIEAEVIILKVLVKEDGEELLSDIEDDAEWEMVADTWQELLESEEI